MARKPASSLLSYGLWQAPGLLHTKLPTGDNSAVISVLSFRPPQKWHMALGPPEGNLRDVGPLNGRILTPCTPPITWDTSSSSEDFKQACNHIPDAELDPGQHLLTLRPLH